MKLLFSEARPDYAHYIFPYAIWAFPEPGETPADCFAAGFLPSSRELDRFYLCRQVRVPLAGFAPSSENRRILRKGETIEATLIARDEFDFTPARRDFCQAYSAARFGTGGLSAGRLDAHFRAPITSHILRFTDRGTGAEVGLATLYLEPPQVAFYSYAFYDLAHPNRSLGMFMMTAAVVRFAAEGYRHLHGGSCYSESALYKTQFAGAEFFNGVRWSANLDELKFILQRQQQPELNQHLLESEDYLGQFQSGPLSAPAAKSPFQVRRPE